MTSAPDRLPSGIVTFVFTDIEQSTRLLRRLGDDYGETLDRHFALMRQAWSSHGGHEVSIVGDSAFVAFADAMEAIRACAEAQVLLHQETWPHGEPLRVRMGVHTGLASPRGSNYVALAVHQGARVMAAAHGGQVLLSGDTIELLEPPHAVEAVPLGRFRLRDFEAPLQLHQLASPGLPADFPAPRALPADGHNLVAPPTRFVGREDELEEVGVMAAAGRLVTLTGPGGVGKTRLATEAGLRLAPAWPDGVWLVDVSTVADDAQLAPAVASAVGAPRLGGDRWDDVLDHLASRRALVIVDSCEHLAKACALMVDDLLRACPGCGVIATSRVPLALGHELVWRVSPLPVPAGDVAVSPAVQLFLDRARAARRGLTLDAETAPIIEAICERLDGLPLALELAAARLGVLSLAQLHAGLRDGFQVLKSQNPTVPERQRTMEALLEWSDRLLGDQEQTCLRRLGVFAAGFSIDAAVAAVTSTDVDPYEIPELVWSLVDKSLVAADLTANDTRYRLLESVRVFARDRLPRWGEADATAARLAAWYLERLGPGQRRDRAWMGEIGVELANLRALIPLVAVTAPERAQELAVTIGRYFDATHAFREGIGELARYAEDLPAPTPTRISLLTCLADLHLRTADVAAAEAVLADADGLHRAVGSLPPWDDIAIERTRGDLASRTGDNVAASEGAKRALDGGLSLRGTARMSSQLGIASLELGDLDTAWTAFARELHAYEELGDESFEASAHGNLAEVALRRGDIVAAARHQRACLALALELGAPAMVAFSLIVAARLAAGRGEWETATVLHAHGESILESIGLALYDADRRLSDEMLEECLARLGEDAWAKAAEAGRALDLPAVAALADRVLAAAVEQ